MREMKIGLIVSGRHIRDRLCLPALEFKNGNGPNTVMWGLNALAAGCRYFAAVMAWYANPFWVAGLTLGFVGRLKLGRSGHHRGRYLGDHIFHPRPGTACDEGNVTRTTVVRLLPDVTSGWQPRVSSPGRVPAKSK